MTFWRDVFIGTILGIIMRISLFLLKHFNIVPDYSEKIIEE